MSEAKTAKSRSKSVDIEVADQAVSSAPVERPRLRDAERTSKAILAAATKEFAERGYGGARVDAIAERAKINKRMLYHLSLIHI